MILLADIEGTDQTAGVQADLGFLCLHIHKDVSDWKNVLKKYERSVVYC